MPRKNRPTKQPTELNDPHAVANAMVIGSSLCGRRDDAENVDWATAMWKRHHGALVRAWIAGWRPGTKFVDDEARQATGAAGCRPPGWWQVVAGRRQPRTASAELAYLRAGGLLAPGEEQLIAAHARRAETVRGLLQAGDGGDDGDGGD
jgi:hypothetical protein